MKACWAFYIAVHYLLLSITYSLDTEGGDAVNGTFYSCDGFEETSPNFPSSGYSHPESRFVVVGSLSEELTKARLHLADVFAFAKVTQRVVVLPSVGRSLIGSRLKYGLPICAYFNHKIMGSFVEWVTEDFFLEKIRPVISDNATVANLFWHPSSTTCNPEGPVPVPQLETIETSEKYNLMVKFRETASNLCVECGNTEEAQRNTVEKTQPFKVVTVMKVTWNCDCFGSQVEEARAAIQYADQFQYKVHQYAERFLGGNNYLAIHWRMAFQALHPEHVSQVPRCLEGLLKTVEEKMATGKFSKVFFASDLGKGKRLMSLTWKFNTALKNRQALQKAVNTIHKNLKPVTMESMDPNFETLDLGVLGIMDKVFCINAAEFVFAPGECIGSFLGKSGSSFVREIESMRAMRGLSTNMSTPWSLSDRSDSVVNVDN